MAQKEVFIEIVKPCWHNGVQQGAGSIVKMKEGDANLCKGLGKGIDTKATAEKHIPFEQRKTKPATLDAKK